MCGSQVVVVGSSFIGMEVALALADKAKVTVVGMERAPFEKILGADIGNGIRKVRGRCSFAGRGGLR